MQYMNGIVDDVFATTWNCIEMILAGSNGVGELRYIGPPTSFQWNE